MRGFLVLLILSMLAACSPASKGEKFLGTWQRIKYPDEKIVIKRNDSDFLLTTYEPSPVGGGMQEEKFVTTLKDGKLDLGMMGATFSMMENGHLLTPDGWEYSKESDSTDAPKIVAKPKANPFDK